NSSLVEWRTHDLRGTGRLSPTRRAHQSEIPWLPADDSGLVSRLELFGEGTFTHGPFARHRRLLTVRRSRQDGPAATRIPRPGSQPSASVEIALPSLRLAVELCPRPLGPRTR